MISKFGKKDEIRTGRVIPDHAITFVQYDELLELPQKVKILELENDILRNRHSQPAHFMEMVMGPRQFLLKVNRENIISDTLHQLNDLEFRDPDLFQKEFKVEFVGEEGLDYGGLRKEFFQLVLENLFDPNCNMFTLNPETRDSWFSQTTFDSPNEFRLLGQLLGIALYNGVNLALNFPSVVYKKLIEGKTRKPIPPSTIEVRLRDLATIDPGLAHGLFETLKYDEEDLEEVFEQTFSHEYVDYFGVDRVFEFCPGGKEKKLTLENRDEFVNLYVDYKLNGSVKKQFDAFKDGFWNVTNSSDALKRLFTAEELESLICGTQDVDFAALRRITKYDGFAEGAGTDKENAVVGWFWEVTKTFTREEKLQLLAFSTGSDRVPVGGLEHIRFVIAKQGGDADRLPTSHTCFNVLMLPEYSSKEKLEDSIRTAIQNSQGFGMI